MHIIRQRGFTLIEMLVATALFVTVMTIAVGSLIVILDANRKAQTVSSNINNVFFSMETMTRLIRTGYDYYCGGDVNSTGVLDCPSGDTSISFIDDLGKRNVLSLSEGAVSRTFEGSTFKITSPDFIVQTLRFTVTGSTRSDTTQPTVTIVLVGATGVGTPEESSLRVQTTLTQRLLDL